MGMSYPLLGAMYPDLTEANSPFYRMPLGEYDLPKRGD